MLSRGVLNSMIRARIALTVSYDGAKDKIHISVVLFHPIIELVRHYCHHKS